MITVTNEFLDFLELASSLNSSSFSFLCLCQIQETGCLSALYF